MISYANIPLLLNTSDVDAYINHYHDLNIIRDRETTGWYGSYELLNFPIPPKPESVAPRIGVLHWPTGASTPATYSTLIDLNNLNLIRAAIALSEFNNLVMSDGTNSITANMKVASVRPLFQITGSTQQLYLLTLADIRWDWPWYFGNIDSPPSSWEDLYGEIGTILNTTILYDSVPSAYAVPSIRWFLWNKPIPTLLDIAAAYIGQRVVVGLDGTVYTQNALDANALSSTQLAQFHKTMGGTIVSTDIYNTIPGNVVVVFTSTDGTGYALGDVEPSPYISTVSLASLSLPGYNGTTGLTSLTATVFADLIYNTTNATQCNALAVQAATDFYNWNLANVDVTLPGIQNYSPTGSETAIEWIYPGDDRLLTRIVREPWQVLPTGAYDIPTCYRTDCVNGVNTRFVSYGCNNVWLFDSLQGCCLCPPTCDCQCFFGSEGGADIPRYLIYQIALVNPGTGNVGCNANCSSILCDGGCMSYTLDCSWQAENPCVTGLDHIHGTLFITLKCTDSGLSVTILDYHPLNGTYTPLIVSDVVIVSCIPFCVSVTFQFSVGECAPATYQLIIASTGDPSTCTPTGTCFTDVVCNPCSGTCPDSGTVTVTLSGPCGSGSYTCTWNGTSFVYSLHGVTITYTCTSSTTGTVTALGNPEVGLPLNVTIPVTGVTPPPSLFMTGSGSQSNGSRCDGTYTATVT